MVTLVYKQGLCYETDDMVMRISKYRGRYYASYIDKKVLAVKRSREYVDLESVNKFTNEYGIRIVARQ